MQASWGLGLSTQPCRLLLALGSDCRLVASSLLLLAVLPMLLPPPRPEAVHKPVPKLVAFARAQQLA